MFQAFCSIYVIIFFLNFHIFTQASPKADLNCDIKSNAKMDALLARYMVIGRHGRLYPENAQQLKAFCKYVNFFIYI